MEFILICCPVTLNSFSHSLYFLALGKDIACLQKFSTRDIMQSKRVIYSSY